MVLGKEIVEINEKLSRIINLLERLNKPRKIKDVMLRENDNKSIKV